MWIKKTILQKKAPKFAFYWAYLDPEDWFSTGNH